MKKVLHLVEAFAGGVYTYLEGLVANTCDKYEIVIAYAIRAETPEDFKKDFDPRVKFIEIKNFARQIGFHDLKAMAEVKRVIKEEKPNIVHLHSAKAGVIGRIAIHDPNIKMFYTPHGYPFLKQDDSKLKRKIYRMIEKTMSLYNKRCMTIACSLGEYEEAKKLCSNCMYVNNGIDFNIINEEFKTQQKNKTIEKINIFTVGRICPQKNPEMFNEIAKIYPDLDFIWIGDGQEKNLLDSKNIRVTGWLDRKEALKEISKCGVFLLTSLWEGLPLSLLEAMSFKKICIVSNIIGNRDVISHKVNGFICNDLVDYKKVIDNLLNNKYDVNKISQNARELVEREHSAEVMAKKYIDIYEGKM